MTRLESPLDILALALPYIPPDSTFCAELGLHVSLEGKSIWDYHGVLWMHGDDFCFEPKFESKRSRGSGSSGARARMWQASLQASNATYVISEDLPGYVKMAYQPRPHLESGLVRPFQALGYERVEGHRCEISRSALSGTNGIEEIVTLWRSTDPDHFPIKLERSIPAQGRRLSFVFTKIQRNKAWLGIVAEGWTAYPRYASMAEMENELFQRGFAVSRQRSGLISFSWSGSGPSLLPRDVEGNRALWTLQDMMNKSQIRALK